MSGDGCENGKYVAPTFQGLACCVAETTDVHTDVNVHQGAR